MTKVRMSLVSFKLSSRDRDYCDREIKVVPRVEKTEVFRKG